MITVTDRATAAPAGPPATEAAGDAVEDVAALERELAELAGVVNAAQGRIVELVARALVHDWWVQAGLRSPVHWVCWMLGCSMAHAHRLVRLARRSAELPETTAALRAGEVSLDQAWVVARHVPADYDRSAANFARHATVSQLSRTLSRYHFEDEPDPGPRRTVASWTDDRGQWRLRAELPTDEGAIVDRALRSACADLTDDHDHDEAVRPSLADGLVAVAETSLAAGAAKRPGADRYTVLAHLEADPTQPKGPGVLGLHLDAKLPDALRTLDGEIVVVGGARRQGVLTPLALTGATQRYVGDPGLE